MDFSFTAFTATGCQLTACSESQVTSYSDFSTNYCNLRNLYCGSDDNCPVVASDMQSSEYIGQMGAGASHDKSACIAGGGH